MSDSIPNLDVAGVVYMSDGNIHGNHYWVSLTKPVVSMDGSEALVYVSHVCGTTCGSDRLVFLKRSGVSWVVVETKVLSQR